ncbi:Sec12-like protein [Thalictrum thalictroides]|uniref:Sec12-like protein n=1 Tax=Thalictrum thalictroides TaxID=46969 RepID=A0A7J6V7B7_THATH|nr:Sec12-like protein [Thalictrum thalictroides]
MNASLRVQTVIKRAHLGIVTVLMFSEDSRSLVSTSFDSSARVTLIESKNEQNRMSIWVALFIVLLAILAYFLKSRGAI